MTPQQIVGLILRLVALALASQSIGYIFSVPGMLAVDNLADKALYAYIVGFLYLFGAVLLWFFPMWVAHRIVPRTSFDNTINLQVLEAARVGCSLIGLWLFAKAFPTLVWYLFRALLIAQNESFFRSMDADARIDFYVMVVELALAIFLVFRSSVFARIVVRDTQ